MNKLTDLKASLMTPARQKMIGQRYNSYSVGKKQWKLISATIDPALLYINSKLYELGDGTMNQPKQDKYIGEVLYIYIRPLFEIMEVLTQSNPTFNATISRKKSSKQEKNKKCTRDLIKMNNIKDTFLKELSSYLRSLTGNEITIKKVDTICKILEQMIVAKQNKTKMSKPPKGFTRSEIKDLLTIQTNETFDPTYNFKSNYVELVVLQLIVHSYRLRCAYEQVEDKLENDKLDEDEIEQMETLADNYYDMIHEAIIGTTKFMSGGLDDLTPQCRADLESTLSDCIKSIDFNFVEAMTTYPELMFNTKYDCINNSQPIKLYPSQQRILDIMKTGNNYLILAHSMLGSGKTSMVIPISRMLITNPAYAGTKLLFTCPNNIILVECAQMLQTVGVKFCIVKKNRYPERFGLFSYKWCSHIPHSKYQKLPNYDARDKHAACIVYICDVHMAKLMLLDRQEKIKHYKNYLMLNKMDQTTYPLTDAPQVPKYILMVDEPTMDADNHNNMVCNPGFSLLTEIFIEIVKHCPPQTILSSATLPAYEQMKPVYDSIASLNPDVNIHSVSSSEAKIGCSLVSSSGHIYVPHQNCTNALQLQNVIDVIDANPFVSRFYTFEVILKMIEIFNKNEIISESVDKIFTNVTDVTQPNIQHHVKKLLRLLVLKSDNIIENVCKPISITENKIRLDKIFTSDSWLYNKGCMVFSSDPVASATKLYQTNFDEIVDKNEFDNIFSQVKIDNLLAKYHTSYDEWETKYTQLNDLTDPNAKQQKREGKKVKVSSQLKDANKQLNKKEKIASDNKWQQASDFLDTQPIFAFPKLLQIGSIEHAKYFKIDKNNRSISSNVIGSDIPLNIVATNELLTMLVSGIGVYTTDESANLSESYLQTVLTLAKSGAIKFLFTDASVAYGTNLAVSSIIIIDTDLGNNQPTIVDRHSIKTLFQMMGRAGRGGVLSHKATVITVSTDDKLINRICEYVRGQLDEHEHDEIANITRAYNTLWE